VRQWVGPLRFLLTVGWYMVVSLLVPTGIGYWLDRPEMFDRHPLFTLIGLGIGTVIAFYGLVRMLRRYKAEQNGLNKDKR
jgi:F0F1-type ATP synthase assembly protein I